MAAPSPGANARGKKFPTVFTETWTQPYAPDSLWNSRPLNPQLGTWQIPDTPTGWYATVSNGSYGIGVFKATAADAPMTLQPMIYDGKLEPGVWEPSEMALHPTYTLPHFPSNTQVDATQGVTLRLQLMCDGKVSVDTGVLRNRQAVRFTWPVCHQGVVSVLTVNSGVGGGSLGAWMERL